MAFFNSQFWKWGFFNFARPIARDDAQEVSENGISVLDPLANDFSFLSFFGRDLKITQIDGQSIAPGETIALANGGKVTLTHDGKISFDPGSDFDALGAGDTVEAPFEYTVSNGLFSRKANFNLTVLGVDDAPVTQADFATARADTTTRLQPLLNDRDPEGGDLRIIAVDGQEFGPSGTVELANGSLVELGADGSLVFDPNGVFDPLQAGETPPLDFTYTVTDGVNAVSNTVTLEIIGVDDAPVTQADFATARADTTTRLQPLANDRDPEGGDLRIIAVDGQDFGSAGKVELANGSLVELGADGSLVFDPNGVFDPLQAGETPPISFTYTVSDGVNAVSNTADLTILGVDDAPVTQPDFATARADTTTRLQPLLNDRDPEGGDLRIIAVDGQEFGPSSGTVELANGSLVELVGTDTLIFDPNGAFDPSQTGETPPVDFTYTVTDGVNSVSNTVTLEILDADTLPPGNQVVTILDDPFSELF